MIYKSIKTPVKLLLIAGLYRHFYAFELPVSVCGGRENSFIVLSERRE